MCIYIYIHIYICIYIHVYICMYMRIRQLQRTRLPGDRGVGEVTLSPRSSLAIHAPSCLPPYGRTIAMALPDQRLCTGVPRP